MRVIGWFEQESLSDVLTSGSSESGSYNLVFVDAATIENFLAGKVDTLHRIGRASGFEGLDGDKVQGSSLVIGQPNFNSRPADIDPKE